MFAALIFTYALPILPPQNQKPEVITTQLCHKFLKEISQGKNGCIIVIMNQKLISLFKSFVIEES